APGANAGTSSSWSPLPPQSLVAFWLTNQQQLVSSLLASLGDLRQLVASAAATWHELPPGAPSAASAATAVTRGIEDLTRVQASLLLLQPAPTTSTPGLLASSPPTLLPPTAPHVLLSNFSRLKQIYQHLQQSLEWSLPAPAPASADAADADAAAGGEGSEGAEGAGAEADDGAAGADSLTRWVPGWRVLREAFIKANGVALQCKKILGPFSTMTTTVSAQPEEHSTPGNHSTPLPTEASPTQADSTIAPSHTADLTPEFAARLTAFHSAYDTALTQVLLGVQSLSRSAKQSAQALAARDAEGKGEEKEAGAGEEGREGEEELVVEEGKEGVGLVEDGGGELEGVEGSIVGWSKEAERRLLVLRLPHMVAAVDAVSAVADANSKASSSSAASEAAAAAAAVTQRLAQLHVMLDLVVTASLHLLGSFLSLHKAVAKLTHVLANLFIALFVAKLTHVLANLFTALFVEGFCTPKDAQEEEAGKGAGKFEEEEGTGMGEGQGKTDVSDEIEDENQLMGTQDEKQVRISHSILCILTSLCIPASLRIFTPPFHFSHYALASYKYEQEEGEKGKDDKLPKGIEMQQDFDGDMHDISEDEEEDQEKEEEGEEEQQLDEEMGDVGDNADVVDEKIWKGDEEEEEEEEGKREKEKFEKDSTISGAREEDLEYRGKDEEEDEEGGEGGEDDKEGGEKDGAKEEKEEKGKEDQQAKKDEKGKKQGEEEGEGAEEEGGEEEGEVNEWQGEGEEEGEEMEESHGITPRKEEEVPELDLPDDMEIDEGEQGGKEEGGEEEEGEAEVEEAKEAMGSHGRPQEEEEEEEEGEVKDDEWDEMDGANDGAGGAAADAAGGGDEEGQEDGEEKGEGEGEGDEEKERDADVEKEEGEEGEEEGEEGEVKDEDGEGGTASVDVMGMEEEKETKGQGKEEEKEEEERKKSERSMEGGKERRKGEEGGKKEKRKKEKEEVNPMRSLGSALEAWKKKVSIAGDMEEEEEEEEEKEVEGETEEEDGEGEEAEGAKEEGEEEDEEELEEGEEMEVDGDASGAMDSSFVSMRWKEEAKETARLREADGEKEEGEAEEDGAGEGADAAGGAREKVWTEIELERMRAEVEAQMQRMRESEEGRQKLEAARDAWRKYELLCSGASQELAEQLRLILEPSMATKLQGDYRSGKRINMKKVIPYIASGFKRDKIWLRRTRPDKRKYQVVLAIDDSRSMSEARCGHLALEAMATICRAMSTIEVGEIGVVAFGEPGNVRMLHELDRPFSPEAAVQVISQFSFKQDNTIADEPMVELLRFLSGALDSAAMRYSASAGTGGGGHLEQLVLIVADGRFHEKETLRRTVRHAMGKGQLLAFILLDSPSESILDMQAGSQPSLNLPELTLRFVQAIPRFSLPSPAPLLQSVSFSDGVPAFSSYLDSFPFPYYILLRDIHALPRTLAGLLRQVRGMGNAGMGNAGMGNAGMGNAGMGNAGMGNAGMGLKR
ncbi:unnamed protein product, partial [Closterium sp. Naga37s-1]